MRKKLGKKFPYSGWAIWCLSKLLLATKHIFTYTLQTDNNKKTQQTNSDITFEILKKKTNNQNETTIKYTPKNESTQKKNEKLRKIAIQCRI